MQWVAQCINGSMYLGILPTTADPNMLIHITVSSLRKYTSMQVQTMALISQF